MTRPTWTFEYHPPNRFGRSSHVDTDWIIATECDELPGTLLEILDGAGLPSKVEPALRRAPLFWYHVQPRYSVRAQDILDILERGGIPCRYVASFHQETTSLPAELPTETAASAAPTDWKARPERTHTGSTTLSGWVVDTAHGIHLDRTICGTGSGARIAVIDDDCRDIDALELDAATIIGEHSPSKAANHAALMVAWATGSRGRPDEGLRPFAGVAPDASPRLYLIPKPDHGVLWLPLAIVRAVDDGADVALCAAYVDGTTSPMLDDALTFAAQLGRRGLGTAIVLPTGREVSSPRGSTSASLTIRALDPASDPRVLCIAPSGREGGWFLWLDKRGKLRPFANRGPAVRCAAPGDDIAYPFSTRDRLSHAESSGASAIAAGACALVLSNNPELRVHELYDLLTRTSRHGGERIDAPVADPADLLPAGRDADGHDVKCGYGRLSVGLACACARDPVAAALVQIGATEAAHAYLSTPSVLQRSPPYSRELARTAARHLLGDPELAHATRQLVRHLRLLEGRRERHLGHGSGSILRSLMLALRRVRRLTRGASVSAELSRITDRLLEAAENDGETEALESAILNLSRDVLRVPAEPLRREARMASLTDLS